MEAEMVGERLARLARALGTRATRRGVVQTAAGLVALSSGGLVPRVAGQEATPGGAAACPPGSAAENAALVERYWAEVWTAGGEAVAVDLLAADELHHWGVGGDTVGPEAFAERLGRFLAAFPDFAIRIDQLVAEGDLVASRWTATATHEGEWLDIAPTGNHVEYTGVNLFRIACGRIAEAWGEADHLGLLRQIGGLPELATPDATAAAAAVVASPAVPSAAPPAASLAVCPAGGLGENRAVARRWFADAVNPRDLALLDEIVAPGAVLHATGFPDAAGPAAMAELFRTLFAGFHDLLFAVEAGPAEGDLVVERWTATGTSDGAFQNLPPTGDVLSWTGINVYRIACGQIAEVWTEADMLGRLRQLGTLPDVAVPAATPGA